MYVTHTGVYAYQNKASVTVTVTVMHVKIHDHARTHGADRQIHLSKWLPGWFVWRWAWGAVTRKERKEGVCKEVKKTNGVMENWRAALQSRRKRDVVLVWIVFLFYERDIFLVWVVFLVWVWVWVWGPLNQTESESESVCTHSAEDECVQRVGISSIRGYGQRLHANAFRHHGCWDVGEVSWLSGAQ